MITHTPFIIYNIITYILKILRILLLKMRIFYHILRKIHLNTYIVAIKYTKIKRDKSKIGREVREICCQIHVKSLGYSLSRKNTPNINSNVFQNTCIWTYLDTAKNLI